MSLVILHGILAGLSSGFKLPSLNGQLVWWASAQNDDKITIPSGSVVSAIAPSGGLFSGSLVQANSGLRGSYTNPSINGLAAIVGFKHYTVGTTSDFAFLYDKSRAYSVFTLANSGAAGPLYFSFLGGNGSGVYMGFGANGAMGKAIRNGNGTASTDLFNEGGIAGEYTFGTNAFISDIFYGYQVTGNDQEVSINNNAPSIIKANCDSSSYSPTVATNELTLGNSNSISYSYNFAEWLIVDNSGLTRAQIDADKAAMKAWAQANYAIW